MVDRYLIGQVVRISVAATDADATAADPGGLALLVKSPDGTITTYTYGTAAEVVRTATGAYHADIALDTAGTWRWRWEATAPNAGADEGALTVLASKVV